MAEVLERTRDRMTKYLRRRGLLEADDDDGEEDGGSERAGLRRLAASAVSGAMPPAGPECESRRPARRRRPRAPKAKAILEMRLSKLTGLEPEKLAEVVAGTTECSPPGSRRSADSAQQPAALCALHASAALTAAARRRGLDRETSLSHARILAPAARTMKLDIRRSRRRARPLHPVGAEVKH